MDTMKMLAKRSYRYIRQTQFMPSFIIFMVLVLFTLIAWSGANDTLADRKTQAISEKVVAVETAIFERMQSSAILLRAGTGLFNASAAVDYGEWQRFYEQFGVDQLYSGISLINYAPIIDASEIPEVERLVRAEGIRNYRIKTDTTNGTVVPLMYAVGYNDTAVADSFGIDMYQDSVRREALEQARDSGRTIMTNATQLKTTNERGIILFRAVYTRGAPLETEKQRRKAAVGYVFLGMQTNDLFENLQIEGAENFEYIVRDNTIEPPSSPIIYASDHAATIDPERQPTVQSTIKQFGKNWEISYFASDSLLSASDISRPRNMLLAGIAIAIIASMGVFILLQYRARMYSIVEEQKLQHAKDQLLSLASHQLRTPATGVKQYVGMVLDGFGGPVPEEQIKLLEQAYSSNERQLQIINEFLYVAKLGSGSLTVTKRQFNLAAVVRDVCDEMSNEIKEHAHTLTLKIPKVVMVSADEHSIRMVIENLISNAVKYTKPGGTITITMARHLRDATVTVRDTGVGIAKDDLHMLFKQFSRIPNDLTAEVNGSGIGLYLAHQLAVRNGGDLTVDSEPGVGTAFTLAVPVNLVKNITNLSNRA